MQFVYFDSIQLVMFCQPHTDLKLICPILQHSFPMAVGLLELQKGGGKELGAAVASGFVDGVK